MKTNEAWSKCLKLILFNGKKKYGETDKEVGVFRTFHANHPTSLRENGEKVVVLIDEYDKPLLRTLFNDDLHDVYREMLTGFYTVLKDADRYLRFVFITGVTKFFAVRDFQ